MATCTDMEEKTRKVLVAVDEGEESMYALSWALDNVVSKDTKDTLILLYAKLPRVMYTTLDGTGYLFSSDVIARMESYNNDAAQGVMEKCKKICKNFRHVKVETKVEDGDPRDVICEAAEKLGVDVLVMGTHGYGLIRRAFLGSVSSHICAYIYTFGLHLCLHLCLHFQVQRRKTCTDRDSCRIWNVYVWPIFLLHHR